MSTYVPIPKDLTGCTEEYLTHSIIVGNGEVPAIRDRHGLAWALPGGETTRDITVAYHTAQRLHEMVTPNLHKFQRRLMQK